MLGTEPVNDVATTVLAARSRRLKRRAGEIADGQGAERARNGALGADWRWLTRKGLLIGRHELGRPRQAGERHLFEARASEVPARLSVAVDEAVAIGRRSPHHRRSHSFPPCVGESCIPSSPVTTSISPCALTFTPATRSPAATTAFTALVRSR